MPTPAADDLQCVICGTSTGSYESARVRCNVRRFRDESFWVWRCPHCRSIHARDPVNLGHYYRDYPSFGEDVDSRLEPAYAGQLQRLERAGITPAHSILDYGCGSGSFLRFLKRRGYQRAVGYDAYVKGHNDQSVLEARYDCVLAQDLIEHVSDPLAQLRQFTHWTKPSGSLVIGTPEASAIDLSRPEAFVHALHMPYHRHIFSADAMRSAAERCGFSLEQYYPTMYSNTPWPGQNPRFGLHYMRCYDDCVDLVTERPHLNSWRFWTPLTSFWFFCGYWFDRHTDVTYVFRMPAPR
jgi:2-polyprenyl-3-methyl-5-hydroxy-6-metoxy-1,4-benzoquinol methylase